MVLKFFWNASTASGYHHQYDSGAWIDLLFPYFAYGNDELYVYIEETKPFSKFISLAHDNKKKIIGGLTPPISSIRSIYFGVVML
jgi:hypothetical protein